MDGFDDAVPPIIVHLCSRQQIRVAGSSTACREHTHCSCDWSTSQLSAMGDGGDGMPFIGSQISLISKSGIRYEGVLHTINMEESSIALQSGTCSLRAGGLRRGVLYPISDVFVLSSPLCCLQCAPSVQRAGGQMDLRCLPAMKHMSSLYSGVSEV